MKKLIALTALVGILGACRKPHEAWTGHKEHKPHAGKHSNEAYFHKSR